MSPSRGTPTTTTRIPLALKARVQAEAAERGETLTDAIIWGLKAYLAKRALVEYVEEET